MSNWTEKHYIRKKNYFEVQEKILDMIANENQIEDIYKMIDGYCESGKINSNDQVNLYDFADRENIF